MHIYICPNASELGTEAACFVSKKLNEAIELNGEARLVVSTGSSQFETLRSLVEQKVDWGKIEIFHLDEYIELPVNHNASFRKYLDERFIRHIRCKKFHSIDTEGDINEKIKKLTGELRMRPVDLGLIGIGVNAHVAFNDPPADFNTHEAFIVVHLDEQCKKQQVEEGWFNTVSEVPDRAVSMTVWQIMQCKTIVSVVPHKVKADAVYKTFTNKLTSLVPATMLKQHNDFHLFLDTNSASQIITF